jgi:hypothetical protein
MKKLLLPVALVLVLISVIGFMPLNQASARPIPPWPELPYPTPPIFPTFTPTPRPVTPSPTKTPTPIAPTATKTPTSSTGNWEITVYYTAVESFHKTPLVEVRGCLSIEGANCNKFIGNYPRSFKNAVKNEGTGRITSGANAGKYLNWSYDTGYWLDTAPRGSYGNVLVPWQSSAADGVPRGTSFKVLNCGNEGTQPTNAQICAQWKAANWVMDDEFTPGLGGVRHVDLYIGEEDIPNFTRDSPKYTTATQATLSIP